jgi:hypothetical protein
LNITGASGEIPVSDYKRRDNHANKYYDSVRKMTTDIDKISQNTGLYKNDIKQVKEHVFFNKYDLGKREPSNFDPDYHMSLSRQLLIDGKNIKEMDIVLLNHEILERKYMIEQKMSYDIAHNLAE